MSTFNRFARARTARQRAARTSHVRYVPMQDYIPAGTADLWKSARPRMVR